MVTGEAAVITSLLDAGADFVHLRHPDALVADVRRIIEDIPYRLRNRIKLHGHFELVWEMNLGGLHLNGRCPKAPVGYRGPLSLTCHSIEEVKAATVAGCYDYVTLSPIFESISKVGYGGNAFTEADLALIDRADNVVALGGITTERIESLARYPFAGFALLGHVWNCPDPVKLIKQIIK